MSEPLRCERIHLGPVRRSALSVTCECCGKRMDTKERAIYFKIRMRAHEIMLLALLANSVKNDRMPK